MEAKELLKNEKVELVLSPHPLSFIKEQTLCLFLIIWGIVFGWLVNFSSFNGLFGNNYVAIALWAIVILLFGFIVYWITMKWITFALYVIMVCAGISIMLSLHLADASKTFIPIYTLVVSIIGFLFVDAYRRTHKYIITSNRIKLTGGIFTKRERILGNDKIFDLTTKQGIFGRIFNYGTITPITQPEYIEKSEKPIKIKGLKSKKTKSKKKDQDETEEKYQIQMPDQKSYFELHGVYPFKEAKKYIEEWVEGKTEPIKPLTTYQKEQHEFLEQQRNLQKALGSEKLDIQKEMKKLPATQTRKAKKQQPVVAAEQEEDEEKDEKEAFQSEQLDIQKEMKELLKKQGETKEENVEEEIDEEEDETEEKS